jgi:hypothetical protein
MQAAERVTHQHSYPEADNRRPEKGGDENGWTHFICSASGYRAAGI